jgi:N-acetylglucosamine-6-sulfatase
MRGLGTLKVWRLAASLALLAAALAPALLVLASDPFTSSLPARDVSAWGENNFGQLGDGSGAGRAASMMGQGPGGVAAVSADGGALVLPEDRGSAGASRPNVILILSDDQRWDVVDVMPTLSSLTAVRFTEAYVTTAMCCPSRSSILTGRYAHNHGVLTNKNPNGGFEHFSDVDTLATRLYDGGYRTGLVGKYLNQYENTLDIPPGWRTWFAFHTHQPFYYNYDIITGDKQIKHYGAAEADYSTDVLAARADQFIRRDDPHPFFLYFAPFGPHGPATPAPRHSALFQSIAPWRPPSYNEADVSDKPAFFAQVPLLTPVQQADIDEFRKNQLRSLQSIDDALARILTALKDTNKLNNTVIIYMGDNGLTWGEHRLAHHKGVPYREAVGVPLLISYPPLVKSKTIDAHFALNIDLEPTILAFAGLAVPSSVDGVSLLPLLDGTVTTWRSDFLTEGWGEISEESPMAVPDWSAVRSDAWNYVEYSTGDRELYDLANDPYEMNSVAGQSNYAGIQSQLATRLAVLREQGKPHYTRVEDTATQLTYHGAWTRRTARLASGGTVHYATSRSATVDWAWIGNDVQVLMGTGPNLGKAKITVDGTSSVVDLYSPTRQYQQAVLVRENLGHGSHTVQVAPTGQKNPLSVGTGVPFDAFDTR